MNTDGHVFYQHVVVVGKEESKQTRASVQGCLLAAKLGVCVCEETYKCMDHISFASLFCLAGFQLHPGGICRVHSVSR